jgi:hypothetical protein
VRAGRDRRHARCTEIDAASRGNDDRVWSRRLGCFVRSVGQDADLRLRLALGPHGADLFPTAEEAERAAKQAERTAKEAALQRIAELEAELAKRR